MKNANRTQRRLFGALLPSTMLLCALLLVGCQSSYVEIPDGNSWDTLGYRTNSASAGTSEQIFSDNTASSGDPSYTSLVLSPDGTSDPTTAADPAVTDNPEVTTDSTDSTVPTVLTEPELTVPPITTQPTVTQSPTTTTEPQTTTTSPITTEPQTTSAPETDVPENPGGSLTVLELTRTVSKGKKATVIIRGTPNTEYTIRVKYSSGYSSAKGLEPQVSDESGVCSWTWTVGGSTKPGDYPITISDGVNSYSLTFTVE